MQLNRTGAWNHPRSVVPSKEGWCEMKIIAILEWDIKERQFAIVEYTMSKSAIRKMRMRYKVLCARYPNNSFRLVEAELNMLAQNIVHSDVLTAMRLADEGVR